MSFFVRAKNELKRLLTFNLHSYWEVFYLDLIFILAVFLVSFPAGLLMQWLQLDKGYTQFVMNNIESPVEENFVRNIAPSGLSKKSYENFSLAFIIFIEMTLMHLMFCALYRDAKKTRSLQIKISADEVPGQFELPRFTQKKATGGDEKISFWQSFKSEIARLFSLDLHSCWEVFYLDAILIISSLILAFPFTYLLRFLSLEETFETTYKEYIVQPVEANIIRELAPAGLDDFSYKLITLGVIVVGDMILFHAICCVGYLYGRKTTTKSVNVDKDVEGGSGCFSRVRVAPKEEKKRPMEKVYTAINSISSSTLYPAGSTEKLIDKAALP